MICKKEFYGRFLYSLQYSTHGNGFSGAYEKKSAEMTICGGGGMLIHKSAGQKGCDEPNAA
jgi:hypothetical protein